MRYYAAKNEYSNSTYIGFSNTWTVLVFDNKSDRDNYVNESTALATQVIKRSEVIQYAKNWGMNSNSYIEPQKFTREYWGIRKYGEWDNPGIPGLIGYIAIAEEWENLKPFYKR